MEVGSDTRNRVAAIIPYRLGKSQKWHVFAGPFKAREAVHAKAIRLGYKVSKEISQ